LPVKCRGIESIVIDIEAQLSPDDISEYCRRVEDHVTRVNAGHLVRIVGPGFELVRGWALAGVPLSVVFRGIDMKAERHREGKAVRPLRIEFCEPDVRAVFENWRRAVGFARRDAEPAGSADPGTPDPKRPSLSRHLDRAIDRLSRASGRLDLPVALRDACDRILQELADMRASAAKLRGAAREPLLARLAALDGELAEAARAHAPEGMRASLVADAAADLSAYRGRLAAGDWQRSVDVTTDRLLRDRLGLPLLEL
jgi:hypothetical protein